MERAFKEFLQVLNLLARKLRDFSIERSLEIGTIVEIGDASGYTRDREPTIFGTVRSRFKCVTCLELKKEKKKTRKMRSRRVSEICTNYRYFKMQERVCSVTTTYGHCLSALIRL